MSPEPLEHVIAKRGSFRFLWALLAPKDEFAGLHDLCMHRWDTLTYRRQQQIYWFLREKKRKHETLYDNPLYAITYCYPRPYNWNGKAGINRMMKNEKMVSALYNGEFGIYPEPVATIFEMTHITPLN